MSYLIILFLISASILLLFAGRHKRRIKRWRKSLAMDRHLAIFNTLYANVNGFQLSQRAREGNDAVEFVYGEIDFESFIALLSLCNPDSDSIFYDLGSGTGKAVLASAMVFNVRKSCGIEHFDSLHQCAKKQRERLTTIPEYAHKSRAIDFVHGNFQTISLQDASIVFINSSAFFGEFWAETSRCLEQLKPGSIVISTSKALVSSVYKTHHITPVKMSWGVVNAYFQQRQASNIAIE